MWWDIVTGEKLTRGSVAVEPHRILDLVDDAEGLDAADAMRSFGKAELPGFAAAMEKL
jgi:hypothetical protein